MHETNLSQLSNIKILYAKKCNDIRSNNINIENEFERKNCEYISSKYNDLTSGFALKSIKRSHFNKKQKDFLTEKFKHGLRDKSKTFDPDTVANEMILLKEKFTHEDRLKAQQIRGFWGQLKKKKVKLRRF